MAISTKSLVGGSAPCEIGEAIYVPNFDGTIMTNSGYTFLKSGSIITSPPPAGYEDAFNTLAVPMLTGYMPGNPQSLTQQQFILGLAYGNGMHILMQFANDGTSSSYLYCTTTDGLLQQRNVLPQDWRWSIQYLNGRFISIGQRYTVVSTDGMNWTSTSSLKADTVYGAAYGAGLYVGLYQGGTTVTSPDAVTWTLRNQALPSGNYHSITFGNGIFLAPRVDSPKYYTSTDGLNWTERTLPQGTGSRVGFGNGVFVLMVAGSTFATSTDGINWTFCKLPAYFNTYNGVLPGTTQAGFPQIAYGDGLFAVAFPASSGDYNYLFTSYDGLSWQYEYAQWTAGTSYKPVNGCSVGNGVIFTGQAGASNVGTNPAFYKKALGIPNMSVNQDQVLVLRIK